MGSIEGLMNDIDIVSALKLVASVFVADDPHTLVCPLGCMALVFWVIVSALACSARAFGSAS